MVYCDRKAEADGLGRGESKKKAAGTEADKIFHGGRRVRGISELR